MHLGPLNHPPGTLQSSISPDIVHGNWWAPRAGLCVVRYAEIPHLSLGYPPFWPPPLDGDALDRWQCVGYVAMDLWELPTAVAAKSGYIQFRVALIWGTRSRRLTHFWWTLTKSTPQSSSLTRSGQLLQVSATSPHFGPDRPTLSPSGNAPTPFPRPLDALAIPGASLCTSPAICRPGQRVAEAGEGKK